MISLPDLYVLNVETNVKIEKYVAQLKKDGVTWDEEDDTYRKDIPVPKTAMGQDLNFELSQEPCFNTELATDRSRDA